MIAADKPPLEDVYLAHFGIKGMRWGHRKQVEFAGPRQRSAVNQQASAEAISAHRHRVAKAAAIGGGLAVAALIMRRGHVKLNDAKSAKIYSAGLKLSGRLLLKTGKTVVKTSGKLSTTVGKTAVKGSYKLGKVTAKGVAKGGIGASKGIAKGTAQGGVDFYQRVLKPSALGTAKVGSRTASRLSGRGAPSVEQTLRSSAARNINPLDLLLNLKADTAGSRR